MGAPLIPGARLRIACLRHKAGGLGLGVQCVAWTLQREQVAGSWEQVGYAAPMSRGSSRGSALPLKAASRGSVH